RRAVEEAQCVRFVGEVNYLLGSPPRLTEMVGKLNLEAVLVICNINRWNSQALLQFAIQVTHGNLGAVAGRRIGFQEGTRLRIQAVVCGSETFVSRLDSVAIEGVDRMGNNQL